MEVVGAKHMPTQSPALGKALVCHLHRAKPDKIDVRQIPADVMKARRGRLGEGDHVMITAVDAMQKGYAIARSIRQPQPKRTAVELDCPTDVGGKQQDVGHAARAYLIGEPPVGCAAPPAVDCVHFKAHLIVRRRLVRDLYLDHDVVGIGKPETVRVEARGRIEQLHSGRLHARSDLGEVFFKGAE